VELTLEQKNIVSSTGDLKINAVAGSGKTATLIEYAGAKPKASKILYLAFNKSVKMEAARKFADHGLSQVQVETAHSLAYKHIVYRHDYKIRSQGYKTQEIAELLNLNGTGEQHAEYIIANHVKRFAAYFCNSDRPKVQDLNYLDTVSDPQAQAFVASQYQEIERQTRLFLAKMDKGEIEIPHDFYLKKFQLSNPKLRYDYILFDEGQDASPAMLDVFLKQPATKVIVGDTHQQIYGWRYAVNALSQANFTVLNLSTSFRFNQDIANLAMQVLQFKKHLGREQPVSIIGKGHSRALKTKAILARTNLGLLLQAIEQVTGRQAPKRIYFEGNLHSYTYVDEGTSLYDVLNLHLGKRHLIKDKLIQAMQSMDELETYIEKTEDVQLGMLVEIVEEYGAEIPALLNVLKQKHVDSSEKDQADLIFSTVHRCKGLEYDSVQLVNDFVTEKDLIKWQEGKKENINPDQLSEEINLLYVAITRTKNQLNIPESLVPADFPRSPHIHLGQDLDWSAQTALIPGRLPTNKRKPETPGPSFKKVSKSEIRGGHVGAYKLWTEDEDDDLTRMYIEGVDLRTIAQKMGRTMGAIKARLEKLEDWDNE
jgi:superfamily I DNA/RNA helicase